MPRVSALVPTYNGSKYLRSCLESVVAQSYQDWELVIVDDCSMDSTLEIAKTFARDSRVRVERNAHNIGLVANWNRCVELARGEWVKFVFQDDLIAPDCLENMLHATHDDTAIVACKRDFIFEQGTSEKRRRYYIEHPSFETVFGHATQISPREVCEKAIDHIGVNFIGEPTSVLLRTDLFKRFGSFNRDLIMICDTEYWIRTASHTGLVYIPETLATFRVHDDSTSARNVALRRYRMNLDGLVLLYEYAFGEPYAALRQVAIDRAPPIDLRKALIHKAREAQWDATHKAVRGDPVPTKEWEIFLADHPRMAELLAADAVPKLGLVTRVGQKVLRTARKSLRF